MAYLITASTLLIKSVTSLNMSWCRLFRPFSNSLPNLSGESGVLFKPEGYQSLTSSCTELFCSARRQRLTSARWADVASARTADNVRLSSVSTVMIAKSRWTAVLKISCSLVIVSCFTVCHGIVVCDIIPIASQLHWYLRYLCLLVTDGNYCISVSLQHKYKMCHFGFNCSLN